MDRYVTGAAIRREAHFIGSVFFFRDENGQPKRKDTFVCAFLNGERGEER